MTDATVPYLPPELADPNFDRFFQELWDRWARRELVFQQCTGCQTFRHPPAPLCHECRSSEYEWTPVAGQGTVFSWTVVTHAVQPLLSEAVPFNVILVEFPDAPGVRLVSNLLDTEHDELKVGAPVQVAWEDIGGGSSLPRFRRS